MTERRKRRPNTPLNLSNHINSSPKYDKKNISIHSSPPNDNILLSDPKSKRRLYFLYCQAVTAFICVLTLVILFLGGDHLFLGYKAPVHKDFTNGNSNKNNNNNNNVIDKYKSSYSHLITDDELMKYDHITTSRKRKITDINILKQNIKNTRDDVMIVFSSGCSDYQNWQSEVLLYSWAILDHPGQITRLVSGCKNVEERIRALDTAIISERVHYFFAPDYTPPGYKSGNPFHYFNKPYSMNKWLREVEISESYIVLIDPDMIITRIFDLHMEDNSYQTPDGGKLILSKGNPISQKYGIGAKWVPWGLCQTESCKKVNDRIAWDHYSVGPPYMMHIDDWKLITPKWVEYSPDALKHDPPPSILAEMYSYAIACAHYSLPHSYIYSMVSDPDSTEAWKNINWEFESNYEKQSINIDPGIHIIHYCHGYWLGNTRNEGHVTNFGFNFHKGHLPKDILHNCNVPLLVEPPTNDLAKSRDSTNDNKHVWMLYQIITRINSALANYKHLKCPNWTPIFKTVLRQPELDPRNRMNYQLDF